MFTLDQIKEAHAKVKSGADFPKYIQELSQLGLMTYTTYVNDGHTQYFGTGNHTITSDNRYKLLIVANETAQDEFLHYLEIHQQGQTDYLTFCKQAADTGTEKWIVDIVNMTCTYYDKKDHIMLVETIPGV